MITSDVHVYIHFLNFLKYFARQQQIIKVFPTFFLHILLLALYHIHIACMHNNNFTLSIIILGRLCKFACIKLPILVGEKVLWANHKNLHNILLPNFLSRYIQFHMLTNQSALLHSYICFMMPKNIIIICLYQFAYVVFGNTEKIIS